MEEGRGRRGGDGRDGKFRVAAPQTHLISSQDYIAQKDALLFAIDVSKSMLKPPPPSDSKNADADSPTAAALKCAYQIMQQRIISTPKDKMGVLLFNTEQSKFQEDDANSRGSLSYPHCYLLNDLDIPSAEDVKALKSVVEDEEEATKLLVPSGEPVEMSNLLFCANQIFTTQAPNFGSRRLFIITDNDNPVSNKDAKESAAVRAKDLYDLGVMIELFPISTPDHEFDKTKFYDVCALAFHFLALANKARTSYTVIQTSQMKLSWPQ
jgi:ATP-dependent DNA helicase 2 subunit 1